MNLNNQFRDARKDHITDYYQTPPYFVEALLQNYGLILYHNVDSERIFFKDYTFVDPCCGQKALGSVLRSKIKSLKVVEFDKFQGKDSEKFDFLNCDISKIIHKGKKPDPQKKFITIMNPPFSAKLEFAEKALSYSDYLFLLYPLGASNYTVTNTRLLTSRWYHGSITMYPSVCLDQTLSPKKGGNTCYVWHIFCTKAIAPTYNVDYRVDWRQYV